jgi:predicted mannosyl-3-phosphoglycerate phosphatase (HAD superfamily)
MKPMASRNLASFSNLQQRSMVVLTCVDGALRDGNPESVPAARQTLATVTAKGVSTVLVSHHGAGELLTIQHDFGLHEPFIAELGRVLYVPRGHFTRLPAEAHDADEWEIFEFAPPSVEDAIETLMWLYRVSGDSPLLVGVGAAWHDRALLRHVDVPVVVAADTADHYRLRALFPDAYVTMASGPVGWREAILGADPTDGAADEPRQ